jgi:hypothetical protein
MDDVGAYMRIILLPKMAELGNTYAPIVVNSDILLPQPQQTYQPHSFRNEYTAHWITLTVY